MDLPGITWTGQPISHKKEKERTACFDGRSTPICMIISVTKHAPLFARFKGNTWTNKRTKIVVITSQVASSIGTHLVEGRSRP